MKPPRRQPRAGISNVDFFHDDWLSGTSDLSLEQRGAYITLCAIFWSKRGVVPDNDRWLAGLCNCSIRKWRQIKTDLIALGKIVVADGQISNQRALIELENATKAKELAEKKGSLGGQTTAKRYGRGNANSLENNDTDDSPATSAANTTAAAQVPAEAVAQGVAPRPRPLKNLTNPTTESDTARAREADEGGGVGRDAKAEEAALIGERCLAILAGNHRIMHAGPVHQWLADGADPEIDIYPTLQAAVADGSAGRAASMSYFTAAIGRRLTQRKAAASGAGSGNGAAGPYQPTAAEPWIRPWMDANVVSRRRGMLSRCVDEKAEAKLLADWEAEERQREGAAA